MRDDIQALRAFAVIAVVLFHVDLPFLAGGYLGVDIFFVISGYVITGLIRRDVGEGTFSFRRFYLRRICRILPASTVTIAATVLVGGFLLTTGDMKDLSASAVAALASLSNVHFWQQSGYFDTASDLKPLLHTWSLAVEEQFYLVWPVVIVAALRHRRLPYAIMIIGGFSLFAAAVLVERIPDAVFYLTPFRAFEFCAGAILHVLPTLKRREAFLAGGALLSGSVVMLDPAFPMPGLYSLFPVAGAMLCIASGRSVPWFPKPVIGLGNASYSIYLAHWPLVVFWKYAEGGALSPLSQAGLLSASLILGLALHLLVERPMRQPEFWQRQLPRFAGAGFFAAAAIAAATAWATQGWSWRTPPEIRTILAAMPNHQPEWMTFMAKHERRDFTDGAPKMLIIGDSHGQDFFNAMIQNGSGNVVRLDIPYRCQPVAGERPVERGAPLFVVNSPAAARVCRTFVRRVFRDTRIKEADLVVLAARWKDWAVPRVPAAINELRSQTAAPIVLVGPQAEYDPPVPRMVEMHGSLQSLNEAAGLHEDVGRRALNDQLRELATQSGAAYVDKFALLCAPSGCPVLVPGTGTPFVWDYGHWTLDGARYFGEKVRQDPALAKLLFLEDRPPQSSPR